ncbi:hypothetical protein FQA39_LY16828 [Lamprigera yunnana]|nr:hypothetical protein FQA39_LY16828 [Lamprigera yunnana]
MDENSYEYECMRAELLGVEKPTVEEYQGRSKESPLENEEPQETEHLKEEDKETDDSKNFSLDNIVLATQKKLNIFKASCGSLVNMLKFKTASMAGSSESNSSKELLDSIDISQLDDLQREQLSVLVENSNKTQNEIPQF